MKIKVVADTVRGVQEVSSFEDFEGCEILHPQDFYDALAKLDEDVIIGAEIDGALKEKIQAEYGIHPATE